MLIIVVEQLPLGLQEPQMASEAIEDLLASFDIPDDDAVLLMADFDHEECYP